MTFADERYELFLALAPARLTAARLAVESEAPDREARLGDALIPLVVDAALLGAEGVRDLALAVVEAQSAPQAELETALAELERAFDSLGKADSSGARVDEASLIATARALRQHGAPMAPAPAEPAASGFDSEDSDSIWRPALAADMLAAFLDECSERTEGLAERLLALEQQPDDRELIGEIFRDLHTLKGSSAFAGLTKMNRVAHRAEDLLGALREGKQRADRATIDVLLQALESLRTIVALARSGSRIDVDIGVLLQRLADPGRALNAPDAARAPATPASTLSSPRKEAAARAEATAQSTLRIEFEKVDLLLNLVGEVVLARGRLSGASETQAAIVRELSALRRRFASESESGLNGKGVLFGEELERLERVLRESFGEVETGLGGLGLAVGQLRDTVMKLRMVPIARLFSKYQRTLRELSHQLGKQIKVELAGAETELDKVLVERLEDPLLHLVRNAADHGIEAPEERRRAGKSETGVIRLAASQRGGQIIVSISDDGRGLDPQKLKRKAVEKGLLGAAEADALSDEDAFQLIFRAGFSTAERVSDVSGRGIGMDVVRETLQRLKGDVSIASRVGHGTALELSLPLTLAITQVLTARAAGELIAIPLDAVSSARVVEPGDVEQVATGTCIRQGSTLVPVLDLAQVLGLSAAASLGEETAASVVLVRVGMTELALLVQQVLGRHEVVIKALGPLLASAPCTAGAALIGERMVLVLDLADVTQRALSGVPAAPARLRRAVTATRARVLVAEDSPVIREAIQRELTRAGFEVTAAQDGEEALKLARRGRFDAIASDVVMPRLDGYELVRALRAEPRYRQTPIVMVTSKDARFDAIKGYDAGADAYLTKPANADELIRTLDALLRKAR